MSKKKTRVQWARDIRAVHKLTVEQTVQGVFRMGRMLIAAKVALDHGEFTKMIESDLPFDASTAQRLMKISRDPRLQKAANSQLLPTAWNTLYELTKLDDEAFAQAVGSGAISEQTTLNDARALRPSYTPRALRGPVSDPSAPLATLTGSPPSWKASGEVVSLSGFAREQDDASDQEPFIPLPTVTIQEIERKVRDLQAEIERGTVKQLREMTNRYGRARLQ